MSRRVSFNEPKIVKSQDQAQIVSRVTELSSEIEDQKDIEIEVRLGNFYSHKSGKDRFEAGVTRSQFFSFKTFLDSKKIEKRNERTKDLIQPTSTTRDNAKITIIYGQNDIVVKTIKIVKKNIGNWEYPNYGMRLSISKEEKTNVSTIPAYTISRMKNRWIYSIPEGEIHLTEVVQIGTTKNPEVWEIELEVSPERVSSIDVIMQELFKEFYSTPFLFSFTERDTIVGVLNRTLGIDMPSSEIDTRRIPDARNLKREDMVSKGIIPKGTSTLYSVTVKADGVNSFMIFYDGFIYILRPPNNLIKIGSYETGPQIVTIFQGELIPTDNLSLYASKDFKESRYRFMIFDCICTENKSLIQENHKTRIKKANDFLEIVKLQGQSIYLAMKEFSFLPDAKTFYTAVNKILDTKHQFKTDGLIFTPNIGYIIDTKNKKLSLSQRKLTAYPDICKWKPPSMLTMDLMINKKMEVGGRESISLLMSDRSLKKEFKGSVLYPFDPSMIEITDDIKRSHHGAVFEFQADKKDHLHPIRHRQDKIYPNKEEVVLDIWEDIHNPISEGMIRGVETGLIFIHLEKARTGLLQRAHTLVGEGKPGLFFGTDIKELAIIARYYPNSVIIEPDNRAAEENKLVIKNNNLPLTVLEREYTDKSILTDLKDRKFSLIRATKVFNEIQTDFLEGVSSISTSNYTYTYASFMVIVNNLLTDDGVFCSFSIDRRQVYKHIQDNPSMWEKDKPALYSIHEGGELRVEVKSDDYKFIPNVDPIIDIDQLRVKDAKVFLYEQEFNSTSGVIISPMIKYDDNVLDLPDLGEVYGVLADRGIQIIESGSVEKEELLTLSEKIFLSWYTWVVSSRNK